MTMSPRLRKLVLTVHITASVGWLGAILAYIALNIPAVTSPDPQTARAAYLMMAPVGWLAIVPLALVALLTGIVQALGTPWGLFRHYWVLISFMFTVGAVAVLLPHMADVNYLARLAADPTVDPTRLGGDLFHSVGGLVVLLVPLILNIYKPRGLTRRGRRTQRAQRDQTEPDPVPAKP